MGELFCHSLTKRSPNERPDRHHPRPAQCGALLQLCDAPPLHARRALRNDIAKLENIISVTRKVKRGDALFRTGDHFDALFAVRSGSIKTVVSHDGGREQVTGLLLA